MTNHSTAAPDAAPLTDPGPPPTPPAGRPVGWDRFFDWVSGLGIARGDGWIGGVCAGIAARLGIDPIIVRGVFVVAALFGLPMFLVYAAGWALLPDLSARIHLRDLVNRRFDPAMVGIGLMLLIGLFPVIPWFFAALPFGSLFPGAWFDLTPWGVLSTLFAVAVIGGIIFLIARSSSHRASSSGASPVPDPRTASADPTTLGEPALDGSGVHAPADPTPGNAPASSGAVGSALMISEHSPGVDQASSPLTPPPAEPVSPTSAGDAELATWRAQHAEWKAHDHAWRRQQQDAERAARDRARAERAAAAGTFAVEAAERRRIRRESNPRTSFGFVVLVIGAALVVGALTSLWRGSAEPGEPVLTVAFGLFAAALVVGVSMIVAGAVRRRSGFLAFLAVVLLIAGTITAAVPIARGLVFGSAYASNAFGQQSFTQIWGDLTIDLMDVGGAPEPIVVDKRGGSTSITITPGVVVDLEVSGGTDVEWMRFDNATGEAAEQGTWDARSSSRGGTVIERIDNRRTDSDQAVTTQRLELTQPSGTVYVSIYEN